MTFIIESEGFHHWIVKCVDKGKLVELHRFYRSLENFVYHRGKAGEHETAAREALLSHFESIPELRFSGPAERKSPTTKGR